MLGLSEDIGVRRKRYKLTGLVGIPAYDVIFNLTKWADKPC
ncbi:MAG: hypothetical protein PHH59_10095 [Methylovulum sp.]|nr:hypothetical protein [Methylovulum sp.]MDD2724357.1 hypothetical protein [Methylovulum sp.]MDD5124810.1 hypothetical protein [Methylovulum sp.]